MLHAFVGPNDSGKSTLLRAVSWLTNAVIRGDNLREPDASQGQASGAQLAAILWQIGKSEKFGVVSNDLSGATRFDLCDAAFRRTHSSSGSAPGWETPPGRAVLLQLDPDAMRESSSLMEPSSVAAYGIDRGSRLAGVYDAILGRGDDTFACIAADVRRHFPTVANLRLDNVSGRKALGVKLVDDSLVKAEALSEGLLYFLAYRALREVTDASLLLIEEPETGLHPARIREVIQILRAISESGTQVLLATHSPLVINELRPEEVSVVTRDPKHGTKVTRIDKTPNFAARSSVYALGELWLSYCDGDFEAPLLGSADDDTAA